MPLIIPILKSEYKQNRQMAWRFIFERENI